jgi:L-alanine-DL-glutamate epimerase-like enolase superfamily enzyme
VGEACGIPIAAGETAVFATQFAALFDARARAVRAASVTKVGGITESARMAALAAERAVKLAPHSPYFGPGALAHLAPACGLRAGGAFRVLLPSESIAAVTAICWSPNRGELKVPQGGPGR